MMHNLKCMSGFFQFGDFLTNKGRIDQHIWIGLSDRDQENNFVYESGATFPTNWLPSGAENRWGDNQPDNYLGCEHCATTRNVAGAAFGYCINDRTCNSELHFVCQINP